MFRKQQAVFELKVAVSLLVYGILNIVDYRQSVAEEERREAEEERREEEEESEEEEEERRSLPAPGG